MTIIVNNIEGIAVVTSIIAVWLSTQRSSYCWPVGLVSTFLYGWIFWAAQLYANTLLQAAFAISQLYGWQRWLNSMRGNRAADGETVDGRIRVKRLAPSWQMAGVLAGALGAVLLGYLMFRFTDAPLPWLDSALTSFSLVGQFWMAHKYISCWWLWIIVDIVYVGLFRAQGLHLTAGLYAMFIVLAAVGWRSWHRALEANRN